MSTLIGQSVPRREDLRFLTGAGHFTDDLNIAGQAFVGFVRSPHAHADIQTLDTGAALSAPGVVAVLTGGDYLADGHGPVNHLANGVDHFDLTKPAFPPETILQDPLPGHFPIAAGRVRHVGEIVAVIVAETPDKALDAAERVAVEYAPLPAVTDARAAAAGGSPQLFDGGNLCISLDRGDRAATETAFARAGHVIELKSHNQRISGIPLEPRAALGAYDAGTGMATLHAPSQGVHRYKLAVASALNMAPEKVRVVTPDVGGGFGVRSCANVEYPLLVWASRRAGRPVKWTATRSETFVADYQARDTHADAAMAFDRDGGILALRLDYLANIGAYPVSFAVLANLLRMAGGPYDIPAMHVSGRAVFTNTLPVSVYRGAGRPEVTFLVERMLDMAADDLGIDRLEIRRRNLIPPQALPYQSPLGPLYDCGGFADNLAAAAADVDWDDFAARRAAAAARGRLAGIGIATYLESPTGAPTERADIRIGDNQRIEAVIGTQSTGQGHETVFAQVVAESLQVPAATVDIVFGDTDRAVSGGGTHSDRSMRLGGTALVRAGDAVIARGTAIAAHLLEAATADIAFAGGRFSVAGTDRSIGLFDVAAAALTDRVPDRLGGPLEGTDTVAVRLPAHPNGVAACEVEIDPETGTIAVIRYITIDDVGRVIHPVIVDGQVHGGIAQGLGQAMMEHGIYDAHTGQVLTGSFLDYCLPRADDLPSFSTALNDAHPTKSNPLGVKGAGEAGTTPATAALVNAVVDALRDHGIRHLEMPLTPERVFRALSF